MSRKSSQASRMQDQMVYNRQCQAWIRSLERNDTDLSALIDLNRSLQAVKDVFSSNAEGELLLLDLGAGKYRLAPDGRDVLVTVAETSKDAKEMRFDPVSDDSMPPTKQELCIDFLLRQKLRRKLLSRVFRRLNRLATAMDGDAPPPGPPKYGDLRLHCDEAAVRTCAELKARQAEALRRIKQAREAEYMKVWEKEKEATVKQETEKEDDTNESSKPSEDESKPAKEEDPKPTEEDEAKTTENERKPKEEGESRTAEHEPKPSTESDSKSDDQKNMADEKTTEVPSADVAKSSEADDPLAEHYEVLRDYKDAYEKQVVDARTTRYPILETERQEDHVIMKYGSGIGSTHRTMSAKEKEMEFKRWQTTLLARIPEQPTLQDLGLDNRVFFLEERRRRAEEQVEEAKKRARDAAESFSSSEDESIEAPKKKAKSKPANTKVDKAPDGDKMDVDESESQAGMSDGDTEAIAEDSVVGAEPPTVETKVTDVAVTEKDTKTSDEEMDTSMDKESVKDDSAMDIVAPIAVNEPAKAGTDAAMSKDGPDAVDQSGTVSSKEELGQAEDAAANNKEAAGLQQFKTTDHASRQAEPTAATNKADQNETDKVDDAGPDDKQATQDAEKDDVAGSPEVEASDQAAMPAEPTAAVSKADESKTDKVDDSGVDEKEATQKDAQKDDAAGCPKKGDSAMDNGKEEVPTSEGKNVADNHDAMNLEEDDEEKQSETDKNAPEKGEKKEDESSSVDDDDDDDENSQISLKEGEEGSVEKQKEEEKKDEHILPPKIVRPISLTAIPSFYDQDLRRIRIVHADLMVSSIQDQARRKLEDCIRDYNNSLRAAIMTNERRANLQNQINSLQYEQRNREHNVKNDYVMQVAMAKSRWNTSRLQFERSKLNKMLPSRNGLRPSGTPATQNFEARPDRLGVTRQVGNCMADIIDAVDGIAQGVVRNEHFTEPFTRPPVPVGMDASMMERNALLEKKARSDLNAYTVRVRSIEEDRSKAWKKMLKTKAEYDIPHRVYSPNGTYRNYQLSTSNYVNIPVPNLRGAVTERMPQDLGARAAAPSFTPTHPPLSRAGQTQPAALKYSTARVRERITANGTVVPLSKPQIKKDGTFQRPFGCARKGMEWDEVRGVWIPEQK